MSTDLSFTTREQYIAWRSAWKVEYKNLSVAIRITKDAIREAHRNDEPCGGQISNLYRLQYEANSMMGQRLASKIIAGLQRNKQEPTPQAIEDGMNAAHAKHEAARVAASKPTRQRWRWRKKNRLLHMMFL